MRQGQQNRRGRGRSTNNNNNNSNSNANNNNSNNNRKPQNPLARNFESSGPDVKIRGTAAQIAEKYMTLARDASSSGDIVMAENYLQHAEHYNRIIMAAQAQAAAASMGHQGVENGNSNSNGHGHGMNGSSHRNSGEGGPAMRDQPQPHIHPQSAPQPQIQPVMRVEIADEQPALNELPDFIQQPIREPREPREPKPEAAAKEKQDKDAAGIDPETGRRRRRRYTAANGTARGAAAAEEPNGNKAIEVSGDDRSSDEALA